MRIKWLHVLMTGTVLCICLWLYSQIKPCRIVVVSSRQDQGSFDRSFLNRNFPSDTNESSTSPNTTDDDTICLQRNICKQDANQPVYVYTKTDHFDQMLHSRIDVTHNITHSNTVIPNIVHFTWYGGKGRNVFRFHHLISVLSAHKFIKPARIYFWCDLIPEGDYFEEAKDKVPELKLVRRSPPNVIYGNKVSKPEHVTDVIRLEVLLEYGGIYFDLDAIVVKPLEKLLYYETVMGWESPSGLCNGIILSTAWSNFLKIWHREYYSFQDRLWAYHSVRLPAELTHRFPNLIHTESFSINRPNWSQQEMEMLYKEGRIYDFKRKNYFIHLWFRQHGVEHSPRDIRTWNTTVGALFRYVYYGDDKIWTSNKDKEVKF